MHNFATLLEFLKPKEMQDPEGSTVITTMAAIVTMQCLLHNTNARSVAGCKS